MAGISDLSALLSGMKPELRPGQYVFCTVADPSGLAREHILGAIREREGTTLVLERSRADALGLPYSFVAAWITLTVHSDLEAVGLTAAFSTALAENNISCNVIAGYYHDHLFVGQADTVKAMQVLEQLSRNHAEAKGASKN